MRPPLPHFCCRGGAEKQGPAFRGSAQEVAASARPALLGAGCWVLGALLAAHPPSSSCPAWIGARQHLGILFHQPHTQFGVRTAPDQPMLLCSLRCTLPPRLGASPQGCSAPIGVPGTAAAPMLQGGLGVSGGWAKVPKSRLAQSWCRSGKENVQTRLCSRPAPQIRHLLGRRAGTESKTPPEPATGRERTVSVRGGSR